MLTQSQINQFRIKARAAGFNEQQIASEIARKQQEESQNIIAQPTATSQPISSPAAATQTAISEKPNYSLGGLAKNAVQDVLDFAVNQPIQTAKTSLGAGVEIARSFDINRRIKESRSKTDQLLKLSKQLKKEKDPVKKQQLIEQSRALSGEVEQKATGVSKTAEMQNPFVKPEEVPTLGQLGKGILRNITRPLGLELDDNGNVVFNLQTALQSAYEKPVTTALMAKDIYSGVKGLGKKGAVTAEKVAAKENIVQKVGTKTRRGVLQPQVESTPFYSEQVAALEKVQKDLGLKGSAQAQLDQLPSLFKKSQKKIKTLLKKADKPSSEVLNDQFNIEVDSANYSLEDAQFSKVVDKERTVLSGLKNDPIALYEQMDKYRKLLKSTRKKIDNGTTPLPKEEARLAAFNALKDTIDTVSPEIRNLNTLQNQMYVISEGLGKSIKKKGAGVDLLGTRIGLPTEVSQGIQDIAGRSLQGTAGITDKLQQGISGVAGKVSSGIERIAPTGTGVGMGVSGALSVNKPTDKVQQQTTNVPQGTQDQGYASKIQDNLQVDQTIPQAGSVSSHPIFGNASRQEVLLQAFQNGLNQKQIDEVASIYDQFAPVGNEWSGMATNELVTQRKTLSEGGYDTTGIDQELESRGLRKISEGTGDMTEAEVARNDVKNLVEDAITQLETNKPKTGPISPTIENIKGTFNIGDQETLDFYNTVSQIKATLAKARAGTSFTPNEEKLLNKYTPKEGDSYQQLKTKLNGLKKLFKG